MKQDEIIEMAKQAGGIPFRDSEIMGWGCEFDIEPLEAFAKMCFEKGRQQGMKQERALEKLAETSREIGWDK